MLPQPERRPDLLIIAGEHSGDQHAAGLLKELLLLRPELNVCALGGEELERAGAQLLWDLTESSVVGLFEVLKNYPFFKRLFDEVILWIKKYRPRAICFVDYPGFNLRLAKRLFEEGLCNKGGGEIKLCYYIGPQIWAWKARRRFEMARWLDSLGVIFPFEVDCYKDTGLDVHFVGHPFLHPGYESSVKYDAEGPILLLPGSRRAAVKRIFPVMLDAFELLLRDFPDEEAVVVFPTEEIKEVLEACLRERAFAGRIKLYDVGRPVGGKAVLGSSGTMSLACALAGIPGAILYKANLFTYFIGKMVVDIDKLGMANILLGEQIYPEYLQYRAKAELLRDELKDCLLTQERREAMRVYSEKLKGLLRAEGHMSRADWMGFFI